ncbi:hypothetical protein BD769DRAFT_1587594, partial [Suillus cothurnatus]
MSRVAKFHDFGKSLLCIVGGCVSFSLPRTNRCISTLLQSGIRKDVDSFNVQVAVYYSSRHSMYRPLPHSLSHISEHYRQGPKALRDGLNSPLAD